MLASQREAEDGGQGMKALVDEICRQLPEEIFYDHDWFAAKLSGYHEKAREILLSRGEAEPLLCVEIEEVAAALMWEDGHEAEALALLIISMRQPDLEARLLGLSASGSPPAATKKAERG